LLGAAGSRVNNTRSTELDQIGKHTVFFLPEFHFLKLKKLHWNQFAFDAPALEANEFCSTECFDRVV
jgi:hypothetical protein